MISAGASIPVLDDQSIVSRISRWDARRDATREKPFL